MTDDKANRCHSIIAIPADGSPAQVIRVNGRGAQAELDRLARSGRYRGVFLRYLAPGIERYHRQNGR